MEPIIQISLDLTNIDEALEVAGAVRRRRLAGGGHAADPGRGAAWRAGRAANFPNVPIVADPQDHGWRRTRAEMMFQAGANMVVVMGQAHDASIIEQVKMAQKYGGKVMCDVMLCPDMPGRAPPRRTSTISSSTPALTSAT